MAISSLVVVSIAGPLYLRDRAERNAPWGLCGRARRGYSRFVRSVRQEDNVDSFKTARTDLFDQYFDWWRRLFSDAFAWAMNQIGQSHDISWGGALQFINDYLLLPLVVLVGLALLLKQTLSD
jgi:hypothetical protein